MTAKKKVQTVNFQEFPQFYKLAGDVKPRYGEIPSCPHNALLEILSRNHARIVPDGFLQDLPVSRPALELILFTVLLGKNGFPKIIY